MTTNKAVKTLDVIKIIDNLGLPVMTIELEEHIGFKDKEVYVIADYKYKDHQFISEERYDTKADAERTFAEAKEHERKRQEKYKKTR